MYRNKQAQFLWHHESCVFFDLSLGLKREPAADSADSHQRAFYSAPRIPSFAWTNWVKKAQYGVAISYFCPFRQTAPLM